MGSQRASVPQRMEQQATFACSPLRLLSNEATQWGHHTPKGISILPSMASEGQPAWREWTDDVGRSKDLSLLADFNSVKGRKTQEMNSAYASVSRLDLAELLTLCSGKDTELRPSGLNLHFPMCTIILPTLQGCMHTCTCSDRNPTQSNSKTQLW